MQRVKEVLGKNVQRRSGNKKGGNWGRGKEREELGKNRGKGGGKERTGVASCTWALTNKPRLSHNSGAE